MSYSNKIQSLFSSFQYHDSPFIQLYNHAQNPNNSIEDQLLRCSNSPSVIDELQKCPKPATHGDVVDEKNRSNKKSIYQLRKRSHGPESRRSGKKSRHSKICTAQGVRDRRMRLSIPTARKFFDLQDLLGFHKPSNTIEWLFSNSQKALEELHRQKPPQGTDGCIFEENNEQKFISYFDEDPNNENGITKLIEQFNNHDHGKKSRERARARARARERTREKMKMKGIKQWCKSTPNKDDLEHSGHSCPFDHSSSHTQNAGGLHERDSNSSSFMEILGDSYSYNSSIFSTMGLVTGKGNRISTCCIPNKKFPFLLP